MYLYLNLESAELDLALYYLPTTPTAWIALILAKGYSIST
jgi:hypothetical protein